MATSKTTEKTDTFLVEGVADNLDIHLVHVRLHDAVDEEGGCDEGQRLDSEREREKKKTPR